ncbi:MAG: bifunctional diaminohydroxyphosphoribosylaminopyrimidine deaminase/5-amino-6-(5-phosphoribosylamino)uracil reductase RibD [Acidimicrobiales bacterium]
MRLALRVSRMARRRSPPNPWVGCVVVSEDGDVVGQGATEAPGGRHAEAVALDEAGTEARGATAYVTLEPCSHHGRTPPCAEALVRAGIRRVVAALEDPDPNVASRGMGALRSAGIEVELGVVAEEAEAFLRPYLVHRRTGRPFVVLKLASTLDGRIAAPDGTSRWITGPEARADVHELRADSDAILVGAATVRADDPELTVRSPEGEPADRQPLRVVLGRAPTGARAQPALEMSGDVRAVLDELGRRGVLQLLVEGGADVAASFHRLGLVDRYVVYVAAALLGGDDGKAMFTGPGASTMAAAWRGRLVSVNRLGDDVRFEIEPSPGDR